ncbi:MAG: hypothetical protein JNK04_11065, partial [Myxococcales bacterium]|nr:hypothetical protein [Myxococcales bacterium]
MGKARLILSIMAAGAIAGCAAVDGIKSKAADFSDMDGIGDGTGSQPFDGPSRDPSPGDREPTSTRARLAPPKEEAGPVRPRPDGPTMEVVKTRSCAVTLEQIAGDSAVAPRTRALAERVLRCDGPSDRYDIRRAPCSLFQAPKDDAA